MKERNDCYLYMYIHMHSPWPPSVDTDPLTMYSTCVCVHEIVCVDVYDRVWVIKQYTHDYLLPVCVYAKNVYVGTRYIYHS